MERRTTRLGSNKSAFRTLHPRDLWLRDRSSGDLAALRHDGFPPLPVPVQPTSVAVPRIGPGRQPLKPPSPCLRGTAADAASDRLGLPRPGQAFALSHFSNASRSAPHWTGHAQDKRGLDPGDKDSKDLMLMNENNDTRLPVDCGTVSAPDNLIPDGQGLTRSHKRTGGG